MQALRSPATRPIVVVHGCDDAGSAVARELHVAGYAVVLIDDVDPPWPRRGMSYVDAWYDGGATLANVDACFCSSVRSIPSVLARGDMIAATTWSWRGVASALHVTALVVAGPAPPVLQDFGGGVTVLDVKADLPPYAAIAPRAGRFGTRFEIAERVSAGDLLGQVGAHPVIAPASGVLRGLSARGARVGAGQCIAEIDTSGDAQRCFGIEPGRRLVAQRTVAALRRARSIADATGDAAASAQPAFA
jgi:xanthine dehydrogenase accessory factor